MLDRLILDKYHEHMKRLRLERDPDNQAGAWIIARDYVYNLGFSMDKANRRVCHVLGACPTSIAAAVAPGESRSTPSHSPGG